MKSLLSTIFFISSFLFLQLNTTLALTVNAGDDPTLNWNNTGVSSCGSVSGPNSYSYTIPGGSLLGGSTVLNNVTTAYSGTYSLSCSGPGGADSDTDTLTVKASCNLPWGGTLTHGSSVTAYQSASANPCVPQTRTCTDGTLSGTYTNQTCTVPPKPTVTLNNFSPSSIAVNGASSISFSSTNATACSGTGIWSGDLGGTSNSGIAVPGAVTGTAGTYTQQVTCTGPGGTSNPSTERTLTVSPATPFACTGTTPANATMCSGDGVSLPNDVTRSVVLSCTPGTKCEYQCVAGHYRTSATVCSQCTANDYCPGGDDTRIDCPVNYTSPVGSDSIGDCVPTPGVCGTAAGVNTYNAPSSNLCSSGSASAVTDSGSWFSWNCTLGSATSCTANQKIDGVCSTFAEQCTAGTYVNSPADTGSDYQWTCNGINTGTNSSTCTKAIPAQPQCSDGSDNDGDGKTDYPTDPGCSNASDTDENAMSGDVNAVPAFCTINSGASTCNVTLDWSVTDPVGATTAITRDGTGGNLYTGHTNASQSTAVPYEDDGTVIYRLYNNGSNLDSVSVAVSCVVGTLWDSGSGTCAPIAFSCSGTAPTGSNFTSRGALTGNNTWAYATAGECTWSCNANYYKSGSSCVACPGGQTSPVGSDAIGDCVGGSMSGTLTPSATSCTITAGNSTCNVNLTWSTTNPVATSAVTRNNPSATVFNANSGTAQSTAVSGAYASVTYYLYNNAVLLATSPAITASCTGSTAWNGTTCQTCSNGGCTNGICNNGATNPPSCTVCPTSSGLYWDGNSCEPCGNGGCTSCNASSANPTKDCLCINGGSNPGVCTPLGGASATLTVPSCTVTVAGTGSCLSSVSWVSSSTTWPISVRQNDTQFSVSPSNSSVLRNLYYNQSLNSTFNFYHNNGVLLATKIGVASCSNAPGNVLVGVGVLCVACSNGGCTPGPICSNGANNPPSCNACTAPLVWNTSSLSCGPALSISTPGNQSITLPTTEFTASYILTNGTAGNSDCYLLNNSLAVISTDTGCTGSFTWDTPAVAGAYGYYVRAVKSSTSETKTSGMFTITVNPAGAPSATLTVPSCTIVTPGDSTCTSNVSWVSNDTSNAVSIKQQLTEFSTSKNHPGMPRTLIYGNAPNNTFIFFDIINDTTLDWKVGTVSCSNTAGNVLVGSGGSCVACSNGGCDPGPICSNGATNPPSCNVCPLDSGLYWDGNSCEPCGNGGCTSCNASSANPTKDCLCINGGSNPGVCTPPAGMSGTLDAAPLSCTVINGQAGCSSSFTWTTTNPVATSQVVGDGGGPSSASANNSTQALLAKYIDGTTPHIFRLYNNSVDLAQRGVVADCASSSAWNGTSCQACANGGCTNHVCNNGATNPPSCNVCPTSSGLYWDGNSCEPCGNGGCNSCNASSVAPTNGCVCNSVGGTPPLCSNMTGTLTTPSPTCTMTLGQGACNQSFTWTTTNPVGTSQVVADGALGPNSTPANNDTQTLALKRGVNTLRLYNNGSDLAQAVVTADCSLNTTWDTINSVCADPEVGPVDVSGQHYYTAPEAISFTCNNSTHYKVIKSGPPDVTFGPYVYAGPVQFSMMPVGRGTGNYSISCIHGSVESVPTSKYYDSSAPVTSYVSVDAYPKTINAKGKSTISWSVTSPTAACKLEVKAVCKNNTCSTVETQAAGSLQNIIDTGYVDNSNSILIRNAVKTIAAGQSGADAKALGKKTFTIDYTTDFTVNCGNGKTATSRVRVANSQEQ